MTATLEPVHVAIDVPQPPEPPAYFVHRGYAVGTRSVPTLAKAVDRWLATGTDLFSLDALAHCIDPATGEETTISARWTGDEWSGWGTY